MKKNFILLVTMLAIFGLSASAQWQNVLDTSTQVLVANGNNIFAGTNDGIFLSQDNGASWVNVGLLDTAILSLAVSSNNIFAGTYNDSMFLSLNNGTSWTKSLSQNNIFTIAIKGSNIFAGNVNGIFRSIDNGNSWLKIDSTILTKSLAISGNNIFAGSFGMCLYLSTNNGVSWSRIDTLYNYWTIVAVKGDTVIMGKDGCGIYLTTDNGNNWVPKNTVGLTDLNIKSLTATNNNIFVGTDNGVFLSQDGGDSWITINDGLPSYTEVESFAISSSDVFIATGVGIWKRPLSELTGLSEVNFSDNNISVYPNPVIDNIIIENPQSATMKILNVQGQLIKILTSSKVKTNIDVSSLSNGVYFLEMETEKGIIVKKIIKN